MALIANIGRRLLWWRAKPPLAAPAIIVPTPGRALREIWDTSARNVEGGRYARFLLAHAPSEAEFAAVWEQTQGRKHAVIDWLHERMQGQVRRVAPVWGIHVTDERPPEHMW